MKQQNKEELERTEKRLRQVGMIVLAVVILMTILFLITKK